MWKKVQERIFPFLIAFSALAVSASAAFYSVSGLSKLFAGASLEVIIMATSLEISKLVIVSLLYQYRKSIPKLLKYYLTSSAVVLVLITSMGIYGFLSAAYQETASKAGTVDAQITLLETKRDNYQVQLQGFVQERDELNSSISDLREGLSNNKIQYRDKETGQIITTTSSSNRRTFERQLDQALSRQEILNTRIDVINENVFTLETEIVEVETTSEVAGELGPLKYLSGLTGIPMDRIINYLLLTIIFVFDPLAIALVIAANFAFEKLKPVENIYGENIKETTLYEEVDKEVEEEYSEPGYVIDPDEWEESEKRMEVIGQNGNTGEHYEEDWEVDHRSPGMYHNGRKIKSTPDSLGQKWTVIFEDTPGVREKILKKDIETVG